MRNVFNVMRILRVDGTTARAYPPAGKHKSSPIGTHTGFASSLYVHYLRHIKYYSHLHLTEVSVRILPKLNASSSYY